MSLRKILRCSARLFLAAILGACSQSSDDGNAIVSAIQDLGLDPSGMTTRITFKGGLPAMLGPGNFEADGGQIALSVDVLGNVAHVVWDERVTPSDQIRPLGIKGVKAVYGAVGTTDSSAPTFAITLASQVTGLGGDTIDVQFSGPWVVESLAEDIASWDLIVDGVSMDLTGSTFDLDPETQELSIVLGPLANLHASFELAATGVLSVADVALSSVPVAGVASGDAVAPTFVSAVQSLAASEYGFAVDFTFSEAMDPVFATQFSNFDAGFPVFATGVEQVSEEVLRITFTAPIVPGLDVVSLGGDLMDAHGNLLVPPGAPVAVTAGTTVANGYSVTPELDTISGQGGDTLSLVFTQALDPDSAEDYTRWDVQAPLGNSLDLSTATFDYDLLTKSLTVTLAEDLVTGADFQVAPSAGPDVPVDVDGQDFTVVFAGTITGDIEAPSVVSVTQERLLDPLGLTLEILLSEDVDAAAAETPANWVLSGGATVQTATLLSGLNTVRLELDTLAIPGEDTLSVTNLDDLAGNALAAPITGLAIASTDTTEPVASAPDAYAFEGADNDTIRVTFDDAMIAAEVEDPLHWSVEMPAGTPLDTSNASIVYDAPTQTAELTFDGGDEVDLKVGEELELVLTGMRDVGGNTVDGSPLSAPIEGEGTFPVLESVWVNPVNPGRLHVQFSEPCDELDDIAGFTEYVVRDGSGLAIGGPASVTPDADRAGATLFLGFGVVAGTHSLDVRGVTDLAGNQMFPVFEHPIVSVDAAEPGLDPGFSTFATVSGEENDVVTVVFDRPMSRAGIADAANYALSDGGPPLSFAGASFAFDGDRTVTITLDGLSPVDLETGTGYTLSVDGLRTAQGVVQTAADAEVVIAAGDGAPAVQTALRTRLDAQSPADSILIEFDEAIDADEAEDVANYLKGGIAPDAVTRLDHRTVRAFFSGGATAGDGVDVTMEDLAGNAGLTSQLAEAAATAGPVLLSVEGVIAPGFGGDELRLAFNEPLSSVSAVLTNCTADQGGVALDLLGSSLRLESASNTVVIALASGVELDPFQNLHVVVDGVSNHDGLAISPAGDLVGTVAGDLLPPDFAEAYVNYRESAAGLVVDVRFSEDVDPTFAAGASNFGVSGGQTVLATELLQPDVLRLTLSAALVAGDTIGTTGIEDAAGIPSGAISIEPAL